MPLANLYYKVTFPLLTSKAIIPLIPAGTFFNKTIQLTTPKKFTKFNLRIGNVILRVFRQA